MEVEKVTVGYSHYKELPELLIKGRGIKRETWRTDTTHLLTI